MQVLVITGGNSSERKISLFSARFVIKALKKSGYNTKAYDLQKGYGPLRKIAENFDVLFPVLHGQEGEGGKLHKFLSKLGKPVVGSTNYKGFEQGWYKIPFKKYCDKNNILTAKWEKIKTEKDILKFGFPCVLNPQAAVRHLKFLLSKAKKTWAKMPAKEFYTYALPFLSKSI